MREGECAATSVLLESQAREALGQNRDPRLCRVHVEEDESTVILTGSVASYYVKQMAQEAIIPVLGHRRLHNRLEVTGPFRKAGPWEA